MTQLPREKKASSKQGKVTVDAHFFMFAHHNPEPVITEVAYIATLCCVLIEKCELFLKWQLQIIWFVFRVCLIGYIVRY